MVDLHYATAQPGAVQLRLLARPNLQAQPRGQGAGDARQIRQAAEAVRLDSRHGLPVGERALGGRVVELAGAEADFEAVAMAVIPGRCQRVRANAALVP